MKRKRLWLLIGVPSLGAVLGCCVFSSCSSARKPDAAIREELLQATPIGSDVDAVERYAKQHFRQDDFYGWRETETGKDLAVLYGCYQTLDHFPWSTCVRVTWHFDSNQRLTEITVFRWLDGP